MRRVVVTGGNKGIGRAICSKILEAQPDVEVLLAARSMERGEAACKAILDADAAAASRIQPLVLDVTSDESVAGAARAVAEKFRGEPRPLYAVVNNAGVGFGRSIEDTCNTNTRGPRRVCEAFLPLLDPAAGRVVNIASASGPIFCAGLDAEQRRFFTHAAPWEEIDAVIQRSSGPDYEGIAYGFSKALLNVYTMQLAQENPQLKINSCSPGYILTDLTAGRGAVTPPEKSNCHEAPLFLLFGKVEANGRYYGSDAVRSPLDRYRGPGDPPYLGD